MKWFRGGLVFKAHRLVYHSSPGSRVIKQEGKGVRFSLGGEALDRHGPVSVGRHFFDRQPEKCRHFTEIAKILQKSTDTLPPKLSIFYPIIQQVLGVSLGEEALERHDPVGIGRYLSDRGGARVVHAPQQHLLGLKVSG